jgi:hypothetical protein
LLYEHGKEGGGGGVGSRSFFLAQSMGICIACSVNLFTSAATLRDNAPRNHAGMKARIGKILIMLAPGTNNGIAKRILSQAVATQGLSRDSTSYPYIVFIGIDIDNLPQNNQKSGTTNG